MNIDDVLRDRLTDAADDAGAEADPEAARSLLGDSIAATGAGGGASGGLGAWLFPVLGAIGIVLGTVAGATMLGGDGSDTAPPGVDGVESDSPAGVRVDLADYTTFLCPGGDESGRTLRAGDRIFVAGRDERGDWVALRDPSDLGRTLWLPTSAIEPDAALDVEILECDEPTPGRLGDATTTTVPASTTSTTSSVPSSTTTTTTTPDDQAPATTPATTATTAPPAITTPPPPGPGSTTPVTTSTTTTTTTTTSTTTTTTTTTLPPPPPDTTSPTIGQASASPTLIFTSPCAGADLSATVSVIASDDRGVASVQGTHALGSFNLSGPSGGGTWTGTFGPFSSAAGSPQVTITLTARDVAGNSASTTTTVTVQSCPI